MHGPWRQALKQNTIWAIYTLGPKMQPSHTANRAGSGAVVPGQVYYTPDHIDAEGDWEVEGISHLK